MIEYAVRKHFPDLPDSTGPRLCAQLGKAYPGAVPHSGAR